MRLIEAFTLVAALSSCGGAYPSNNSEIDPDLVEYVSRFEEIGDVKVRNMAVSFGSLSFPKVGECRYQGPLREIVIDEKFWQNLSDLRRESLMFHELGHCALNQREHRNEVGPDECPLSVMNEYLVSETCYVLHRRHYVLELFGKE